MAEADRFGHVTIIGVGLLGGSAGLAIKARAPATEIAGVGRRWDGLAEARARGAIDTMHLDAAEVARRTDLVILATPVGAFAEHLRRVGPLLRPGAMVTDVGSTKAGVVRIAEEVLSPGGPFVGSHPMAGSERKGVAFARADLFQGATCIVTPTAHTPRELCDRVERFWRLLGMRTRRMTPQEHDVALARVSHLPHVVASLLMVLPSDADLEVAATGFHDATRLAAGDPEMWRDILAANRGAILDAIDRFGASLTDLRALVDRGDRQGIEAFFAAAKKRRDSAAAMREARPAEDAE